MWFNVDLECKLDILKFEEFFFRTQIFWDCNLAYLVFRDNLEPVYQEKVVHGTERVKHIDIYMTFSNLSENSIDLFADVKTRLEINISENVELLFGDMYNWFHDLSLHLNSKVYVDFDEPLGSPKFGLAWCIDGNKRSVVFNVEDDEDIPNLRYVNDILRN